MSQPTRIAATEFIHFACGSRFFVRACPDLAVTICLVALGITTAGCQPGGATSPDTPDHSPAKSVSAANPLARASNTHLEGRVGPPVESQTRVWLTDLTETNVSLGSGKLGKHGLAGCVPGGIRIHGISSHHGLGMHAEAHVEYVLD